ncbi:M48 family metallopeptidase [Croceibacterium sp. LX-88]|jgi:predicted metal-dependent hydrolase|uniref:M48 family metallopeptidase n=1 Tax=Croceibacterium selenioxidans TaxID=2838833 RepID=A0ABS5W9I7_9SPHN|nr:SprT family zinc-dependent metalloprotease [Croceibacterium selenioxidans]MBT2135069.1 M48 family metallopeptidase [Croceibacterium selenioxidans]
MIDWLRPERQDPKVTIGGQEIPLAIRRHARAKRMTMRLAPDGSEVRITMPQWGRTMDALVFVKSRSDWLERQLAAVPDSCPPVPGGTLLFRGVRLSVEWEPGLPRKPAVSEDRLRLGGPRETVTARVRRWLEAEALRLLSDDLAHYCALAGQAVPQLRLSRAVRRWGSCSGAGCIRINWRLIQAPDTVRRSVVAHEVAHLVHFDHSPAFHALLARLFEGDLRAADRWLKLEGRGLYAALG